MDVTIGETTLHLGRLFKRASQSTLATISWWLTILSTDPVLALRLYALFELAYREGRLQEIATYIDAQTGCCQRILARQPASLTLDYTRALNSLFGELEEKIVQQKPF